MEYLVDQLREQFHPAKSLLRGPHGTHGKQTSRISWTKFKEILQGDRSLKSDGRNDRQRLAELRRLVAAGPLGLVKACYVPGIAPHPRSQTLASAMPWLSYAWYVESIHDSPDPVV